jgi:DNA-binding FrmR family transcriptional regulator
MDDSTQKAVSQRLASAAGHIKGIERMVNDDVYCIDTFRQIQAVQSALNKVSVMILDTHLHTCLAVAVHGKEADERERMLQEVVDIFEVSPNQ